MGNTLVLERESGKTIVEKVPLVLKLQLWFLFATPLGRLVIRSHLFRKYLIERTNALGPNCDHPDSASKIPGFVLNYGVDLAPLCKPLHEFRTLNEFFYRELDPASRPIHDPSNDASACQPADCRLVVFPSVDEAKNVWIKGEQFSIKRLVGRAESYMQAPQEYDSGSIVVCRLAPTDYHRFHSPVSGTVVGITSDGSELYTVKPVAVCHNVNVLTENRRVCLEISTKHFGTVMYVLIGATDVASVNLVVEVGSTVQKGAELGYFAFGGSCVVAVFPRQTIVFDQDLEKSSRKGVEMLVKFGTSLGHTSAES